MKRQKRKAHLGFIGLGNMGAPLARRLIEYGYEVELYDVKPSAIKPLAKLGGKVALSAKDVASRAQIVFTCLASLDAIEKTALGPQGIRHGGSAKIYIDMSTTNSQFANELARKLAHHGIKMLDCPITGGIRGASNGSLAVIVSGAPATYRKTKSLLNIFGKTFFVSDIPGRSQTMKLINNLLATGGMAIAFEGFVMGAKAGLDPDAMVAVINSGTGRNNATLHKLPGPVLKRTFDYGSNLEIPYKDICSCLEEAEKLGVTMWVGNAVKQLLGYGIHHGGAKQDGTRLITHLEKWANTKVISKAAKAHASTRRTGTI